MLGLRVLTPPGSWMSVSCECCVLSGTGLCDGPITRTEKSYIVCSRNLVEEGSLGPPELLSHKGGKILKAPQVFYSGGNQLTN